MASSTKKRIVLYFPQQIDGTQGRPFTKDILPLSLLTIAGIPDRDGYDVVLVDGGLYSEEEAHRRVLEACEGALLYATTGILGHQVTDGYACSTKVKGRFPSLPAFIGGWFASTSPELQLRTGLYDAVAIGQGELIFSDIVLAVDAGEPLDEIPGLALLREGNLHFTPTRHAASWKEFPRTPWHLIDFTPYRDGQLKQRSQREEEPLPLPPDASSSKRKAPHVGISYFSSYGCPLQCTFCCSPAVSGLRWKAMPAELMLDDIQDLQQRWGFDVVRFLDANYGVVEDRVRSFAEGLLERDIHIWQYAMLQASSIVRYQPETLDAMAASGIYNVLIGGEAGTDEMMEKLLKTTRGEENIQAGKAIYERGMDLQMSFIIGFPGEDEASMLATIDQARRVQVACPGASPMVWHFRPIPGTPLFPEAIAEGYVAPQTFKEWGESGSYWMREAWPGHVPPTAARARRLYQHFAGLSKGVIRDRIGFWERRARHRIEVGDFRFGRVEAKAFDLTHRLTSRLRGARADTSRPHRIRAHGVPASGS